MAEPDTENGRDSPNHPVSPLEQDLADVQGAEPDDAQDAAIALGTAPPEEADAVQERQQLRRCARGVNVSIHGAKRT